jgi:hypothetical protein
VSRYGTSVVRRLQGAAQEEFDGLLLEIAGHEKPNSVRGMYYQAMGADLVDRDAHGSKSNYNRVQRRILALRRAGIMPYSWITDGSRIVYGDTRYKDLADFAVHAAGLYRKDYWSNSPHRVEVWVEKDAMAGKLQPVVVRECGLDLYVSRGFSSETYLQEAAVHMREDGRPTTVYLLTDFDASGMNIAETVGDKLVEMAAGVDVDVRRIAATPEQIDEFGLITQPVIGKPSHVRRFVERYGTSTVELDAIPAREVRRIVKEAIEGHMDPHALEIMRLAERSEQQDIPGIFGVAA